MNHRLVLKCLRILAAGLLLLPLAASADSSPEAAQWLQKVAGIYEKGPLTADFAMEMAPAPTMPVAGKASGRLIQQDARHIRVELAFEMGGAEGQPGMKVNVLSVSDGTTIWNEVDTGMGKQVSKLAFADADEMAQQNPLGVSMGGGGMDPVAQVEKLAKIVDFEVVDTSGGQVTLRARLTEEALKNLAGSAQMPGFETVTLVLDEEHAFPVRLTVGGAEPMITMSFSNLEFVPPSDLPADAFEYTPPEGVPVIDAAEMMRRQGGG